MTTDLILASGSATRAEMLRRARVPFRAVAPKMDEDALRDALIAEGAGPRDIADALAEAKARRIASKQPDALVIGSDQTLEFEDRCLAKPASPKDALFQLRRMRGHRHMLHSAAVVFEAGAPVWRHVGTARLHMREASDDWLADYVERNWDDIRHSVGGYLIESEGVRLFDRVEGDHFHILGLPLVEILSWLTMRGTLPG